MVAAGTSAVVFPLLYVLGFSTTVCSIAAFVAGAIPNWTLNRRWTWKVEGRIAFGREVIAYVVISGATLVTLSLVTGWTLTLGIDAKSTVLLVLSLMVASMSLGTGRTTVLQGAVHLVIFAVYLETTVIP